MHFETHVLRRQYVFMREQRFQITSDYRNWRVCLESPSPNGQGTHSTPWIHQTLVVAQRSATAIWRNPTYVTAKLMMNIAAGLFIGFTFWKSPSTMQGIQNKLFSTFIILILPVPRAQQLRVPFIASRTVYEIRERPGGMYSWSAWVTDQILVELPWDVFGGVALVRVDLVSPSLPLSGFVLGG